MDMKNAEIKRTVCDICTPSCHCGIDAYVKDGAVVKLAGMKEHPASGGRLCAKGYASRQYISRADRIKTPLLREGKRGENNFRPITWEYAYDIIAEKLGALRSAGRADEAVFYSGYGKWYRPLLRRLCHAFGSQSFGTESSACATSKKMAWRVTAGCSAAPDLKNAKLFLGWALNPYYSNHISASRIEEMHRRGMKLIVIDPRITPATEKLADLHLRPRPGTDGALALSIADILIKNGWYDREYVEKYVHGFDKYREYVSGFDEKTAEALTGVPYSQILKAAEMIHSAGKIAMKENSAPLSHHRNGFQTYRAVISLLALTGSFDAHGGQRPIIPTFAHVSAGFPTREREFTESVFPENAKKAVGAERFPLWYALEREMQAMDLSRAIMEEKPYKLSALFACGLNMRMFPDTDAFAAALERLDFIVNCDLFFTDSCKYADIVLPVCSSFERGEIKVYPGGYAWYTRPAIEPLYESKSDAQIICELSERLGLSDELLSGGYEKCAEFIFSGTPVDIPELKKSELPVKLPGVPEYVPGERLKSGLSTPTGKIELYSELIARNPEWGLDALPTYTPPIPEDEMKKYPLTLDSGGSIPNALHSRLHDVPNLRALRPEPLLDICRADAERYGLSDGDAAEIYNDTGCITAKAHITETVPEGTVFMYHGYREANVCQLVSADALDKYTGFPAYRSVRCAVRRRADA